MSTAPNFAELFNFKERFELAACSVVTAALQQPVAISGDTDRLLPEHVSLEFRMGKASDAQAMTQSGTLEYVHYIGCTLSVEVCIPRDKDEPTAQEEMAFASRLSRAASVVRSIFRESASPLNPSNLGYYSVTRLQPSGEAGGMLPELNADVITLSWDLDFEIIAEAWPIAIDA